jgi:integrase
VAYAEKRGKRWRARWRGPDGTLESKPGFQTRKAAEDYGNDQEAAIRASTYIDPRAGRITLTDWVNQWYPSLDLEPTTLANYRYLIEVHILPVFANRPLASITAEEIASWERRIVASGYSRRTARDARSTLTTVLGDAIPHYIQANPAQRRRGKGSKGQRRIERIERTAKAWPTPLEALLVAERCAALSGHDTDFVMVIVLAYTGMRWSEIIGLTPACVPGDRVDISWKLYELRGRFYRGRPKDGSIRTADLPPFLADLLARQLAAPTGRRCTCRGADPPWCPGDDYVFLGPGHGHFRRSSYGERFFRPASDGWYPARGQRPAMPVLADVGGAFPGRPVPPWPAAVAGEAFTPPTRRGVPRLLSDATTGRCPDCGRALRRRLDGGVVAHKVRDGRCNGSGRLPSQDVVLGSWLPLLPGLTPHGLRHGHQTWLDEAGVPYVLQSERMGHEMPGIRGVYSHVSLPMRGDLVVALEERWQASLLARAQIAPRSSVHLLDELLPTQQVPRGTIGHHLKVGEVQIQTTLARREARHASNPP